VFTVRGGSTGGLRGLQPPYCPKLHGALPKILETIDEGREGAKKKGHQPPYLPFLASPLFTVVLREVSVYQSSP